MQKLVLSLMLLAGSAMAAPISCGHAKSEYRLWVNNDHRTATVTINGQVPQFGQLTCRSGKQLVCISPHVADAGYGVTLTTNAATNDISAKIEEMWIGGTRLRATLPCVAAMNF